MSYTPQLKGRWWQKHGYFKRYMLREATVLPLAFLLCSLLAGAFSVADATRFEHWQSYMAHPVIMSLHGLALIASLYHAATFFVLFPRVMPVRIGARKVPDAAIVGGQWAAVLIVLVLMLGLFVGGGA